MKIETILDMIENIFKSLEEIENEYYNAYNGKVFEVAVYLYIRYGEIPLELYNRLEEVEKILKKEDSLFNGNINYLVENMIIERGNK